MKTIGIKVMAATLFVSFCWIGTSHYLAHLDQPPAVPVSQVNPAVTLRARLYQEALASSISNNRNAFAVSLTDSFGIGVQGGSREDVDDFWHDELLTWEAVHHVSEIRRAAINAAIYRRAVHDANEELRWQLTWPKYRTVALVPG